MIAVPKPPKTFGSSFLDLYLRKLGRLARCNSSITGLPSKYLRFDC